MKETRALALLLLAGLFFIQELSADKGITENPSKTELVCGEGEWDHGNAKKTLPITNFNDVQYCKNVNDPENPISSEILIRIRTCDNCIELDIAAISAIALGNIFATVLIGWAVYSLVAQPKAKGFSGNKASDKVNLLHNGEGDTYQPLSSGQVSEYSALGGGRRK